MIVTGKMTFLGRVYDSILSNETKKGDYSYTTIETIFLYYCIAHVTHPQMLVLIIGQSRGIIRINTKSLCQTRSVQIIFIH